MQILFDKRAKIYKRQPSFELEAAEAPVETVSMDLIPDSNFLIMVAALASSSAMLPIKSVRCKTASTLERCENLTAVTISLTDFPVGSNDDVGSLAAIDDKISTPI